MTVATESSLHSAAALSKNENANEDDISTTMTPEVPTQMTPTINSKRKFYLECAVYDKLQSIVSFGAAFTKKLSIFNIHCHQHRFFDFSNSSWKFTCIN